jgi:Fic family protein
LLYLLHNKTKGIKENCEKLQDTLGETNDLTDLNKPRIISRSEYNVPTEKKSVSFRVQRRRQRIVALWNTAKRFSVGKAAECLGVSRWTVERDLAFLRKYDLLSPKRACLPPFEVLEKAAEYMNRFNAAHQSNK